MKDVVVDLISKQTGLKKDEVTNLLEVPPIQELGDFAFPCYVLAKKEKKSPLLIAEELTEKFRKKLPKEITNVDFKSAYVNFFIDKKVFAEGVLKKKLEIKLDDKVVLIEFSQPNTHKAFHVGHIRGTSVGESLSRIFEFVGNKVIRANYSGDTGMHIAKWIWCYQKYHSSEKLNNDESWIAGIYVDAVKRLGEDEELQKEVDEINRKIESKEDRVVNNLWEKTRKLSIDSWKKIYSELNTDFDVHFFESETELPGKEISLNLLKKGIAVKDDDAVIMDLKEYNLGVWVLLRRDGTVLYSAKDIALAQRKLKDFPADRYLVTVGDEQKHHFEQLKKTLELMKFKKADSYDFLPFGMVRFPEGKMSSRTGQNILYSDFIEEVKNIAKERLETKNSQTKGLDERALKVSIAAIKYSMLKQDPRKSIIFDPKSEVAFEGDTGPYLLYSYARANSIIKKVKNKKVAKILDLKDAEIALLKKIDSFSAVVGNAYKNLAPNLIANYSYELAKLFNEFYHACPVLGSSEEGFRLALIKKFKENLKESLSLLGIQVIEEM
ncbi:arginine--tRNA ligase [archaeon]|nr:arginine--tRNA ligase [archaeon]